MPIVTVLAVGAAFAVSPGVAGADDYSYPLQGNFVKFSDTSMQVQAHQVSSTCAKLQNNNSKAIKSGNSNIFGTSRLSGYEVDLGKITMETGGSCGTERSRIKVSVKSGSTEIATLLISQRDVFGIPIRGSFKAECGGHGVYECVSNGIVSGNFELYIRQH
jgi:hypothetical protein